MKKYLTGPKKQGGVYCAWSAVMIIPVHQWKKVFDKCPNRRIKQQRETI